MIELHFRNCHGCGRKTFMRPQPDGRYVCGACLGMVNLPPELDEPERVKCDGCGEHKPVPLPDLKSYVDGGFVCAECREAVAETVNAAPLLWCAAGVLLVVAGVVAGWVLAGLAAQKS